jgi:acyl carrier protein
MDEQIRRVLEEHGKLSIDLATFGDSADLYQAGLTSYATVNVMLGLEEAFDIEFPQALLRKRTFESIASIREALSGLLAPVTS